MIKDQITASYKTRLENVLTQDAALISTNSLACCSIYWFYLPASGITVVISLTTPEIVIIAVSHLQ